MTVARADRRRGRRGRLPATVEPRALEREYDRELRKIAALVQRDLRGLINDLRPDLEDRADGNVIRLDGLRDALRKVRRRLRRVMATIGRRRPEQTAERMSRQIDAHNERQVGRQVGAFVRAPGEATEQARIVSRGVVGTAATARAVDAWNRDNVRLIVSVPEQTYRQVEGVVRDGFRRGLRQEQIAKLIEERGVVAQSRARLIARDQVGKLNGQLTRARHEALGAKSYKWRTSLDERVRDEHAEREGQTFAWDAPPFDGHPGEPINCRCTAEPLFDEVQP